MTFEEIEKLALEFRDERDWAQFHNPKDLAISISLEAAELLETFQWSGEDTACESKREAMKDELADVFIYAMYMAQALGEDVPSLIAHKFEKNGERYPVEIARGTSRKYTEL
jgi:NTP pyrophosphatase (non-canonical NTP hydrolase)